MGKIRWSNEERQLLLDEVKRQYSKHPHMSVTELTRIAQKLALPSGRRRTFTSVQSIEWINKAHSGWNRDSLEHSYAPNKEEIPKEEPKKPDLKELIIELLADAMVQVVAEAIVKARQRLDLPCIDIQPQEIPTKPQLKNIVVYGLIRSQEQQVRKELNGCYNLRFLKDVTQDKLISGAQWADYVFIMTKFVSHDYEAIKKYKNIRYSNGGVTDLINKLETMYLEENKE